MLVRVQAIPRRWRCTGMASDRLAVGHKFRVDEAGRRWVCGCRLRSAPVRVVPTQVQGSRTCIFRRRARLLWRAILLA
jgi:hypothetical protein